MSTLEKAIQIAAVAHTNQKDKAGQHYILHPIKVMLRVNTEMEQIVAVLHDVVEDSDITLDQLKSEGFSEEILTAIDALTKRPGETRIDAAKRAALNKIACTVKLADNAENSDISRIPNPTQKDLDRLQEYKAVREILNSTSSNNIDTEKSCSICGLIFPMSEYNYGNRENRSYCKKCDKEEKIAYNAGGKEAAHAYRERKRAAWKKS